MITSLPTANPVESTRRLATVDDAVCAEIAALLRNHDFPAEPEPSHFCPFPAKQTANLLFALVAISHQISGLWGGINRFAQSGWDYMLPRFTQEALKEPTLLFPKKWSIITTHEVCHFFRGSNFGETPRNPDSRAELLRDAGRRMQEMRWQSVFEIYQLCKGRIASGEPNLLNELSKFKAYSDPVQSKSFRFLSLMKSSGLWSFADDGMLGPSVDHHEVRGHLRLGTVRIINESIRERIFARKLLTCEEDVAIRHTVVDAIERIAQLAGTSQRKLHYLFWNLFSSICESEFPKCSVASRYDVPEVFSAFVASGCPFTGVCANAGSRNLIPQHIANTEFY
jgi:hypothetical protein